MPGKPEYLPRRRASVFDQARALSYVQLKDPGFQETAMDVVTQSKAKAGKGKAGGKNGHGAREAYYDRISKLDMAPLWVVLKDIIPEQPKTVCAPAIWRYFRASTEPRKAATGKVMAPLLFAAASEHLKLAKDARGRLGGAIATHVRIGSPLFTHVLFPIYVAALLWGGLYARDERVRTLISFRRE